MDEAIRLRPDDAKAYNFCGYAKAGMGRFGGAFDDLRTGLDPAPKSGDEVLVADIERILEGLKEQKRTRLVGETGQAPCAVRRRPAVDVVGPARPLRRCPVRPWRPLTSCRDSRKVSRRGER